MKTAYVLVKSDERTHKIEELVDVVEDRETAKERCDGTELRYTSVTL